MVVRVAEIGTDAEIGAVKRQELVHDHASSNATRTGKDKPTVTGLIRGVRGLPRWLILQLVVVATVITAIGIVGLTRSDAATECDQQTECVGQIVNASFNLCLAVPSSKSTDHTTPRLKACKQSSPRQTWYRGPGNSNIKLMNGLGKCLQAGKLAPGKSSVKVSIRPCTENLVQRWTVAGAIIKNAALEGFCLSASMGKANKTPKVKLKRCGGSLTQQWHNGPQTKDCPAGACGMDWAGHIENVNAQLCLRQFVELGRDEVHLDTCPTAEASKFRWTWSSFSNPFQLRLRWNGGDTGNCLAADNEKSFLPYATIAPCDRSVRQLWSINDNGTITLNAPGKVSGLCLSTLAKATQPGTFMVLKPCENGAAYQKWTWQQV